MSNNPDYMREYMKRRYHKRRAEMVQVLGGKCVKCGSVENLEFDHIDPDKKEAGFEDIRGRGWVYFMEEVEKCQLLCKPCHIDKTLAENGMSRATHGRLRMYRNGCRCHECKSAQRIYMNGYRAKKKQFIPEKANSEPHVC